MDARRPMTSTFGTTGRNRRCLHAVLTSTALALLAASSPRSRGWPVVFSAPPGLNRKQRGNLRTRDNLPDLVVLPLEGPGLDSAAKAPLPERHIPYTLHIVSHVPSSKHQHEESNARRYIEQTIVDAFENMEDLIKHIEVRLKVSENFHSERPVRRSAGASEDEDKIRARLLAPFVFKVSVSLVNHRSIVLANAERHAQPTLSEGLDHMVDAIRRSLREEKDKMIQNRKRQRILRDEGSDELGFFENLEDEAVVEDMELAADREAEEMYRMVERARE